MKRTPLTRKTPLKKSPLVKAAGDARLKPVGAAGKRRAKAEADFRRIVKANAGPMCEFCLTEEGEHVHHGWTRGAYPELRCEPASAFFLCADCHSVAHLDMKTFRQTMAKQRSDFAEMYDTTTDRPVLKP